MTDPRRQVVLSLILEWDHAENPIFDHLGMTPDEWLTFRECGGLPRDYQPREPKEHDPHAPDRRGRPSGWRVCPEKRRHVRELLGSGMTGTEAARVAGVSKGTAHNIKREMAMEKASLARGEAEA